MGHSTFRLAALLLVRKTRRDMCRTQLVQSCHTDEIIGQRQEELDRQRSGLLDQCREAAAPGAVRLDRLIEYRHYDQHLTAQQDELAKQRQDATLTINWHRKELLAANREVRILEKLEAKQQDAYRERGERRETRMLDEMAVIQYAR
ncbi:MAG: flagellar export protein FliJ [Pirellulales bacterium]|nr:flagellar export protein FliJ [Pirellulales bacterium]